MPELPEVERVRRTLQPAMEGAQFVEVIARRPDLRRALPTRFAERLAGQTVRRLNRRGKYLLAELSSGDVLLMHLGMSGSFRVEGRPDRLPAGTYYTHGESRAHDHIVFRMSSGAIVTFNDPRRFGSMDLVGHGALPAHRTVGVLGPEPLDEAFTGAHLAAACRGRRISLKAALMDQRVVAGLGNIYACEALHLARLSPRRRASTIATTRGTPRATAGRLTRAIKTIMLTAIGDESFEARDRNREDEEKDDADRFRVYGREGLTCPRRSCRGTIRRIVQGGRSTFFCPVCQQ